MPLGPYATRRGAGSRVEAAGRVAVICRRVRRGKNDFALPARSRMRQYRESRDDEIRASLGLQNVLSPSLQGASATTWCSDLMHPPHVVRRQTCRHRFHAFAFSQQQQSRAIHLQRHCPISVPRGLRQAIYICRKAFLLWAWRGVSTHKTILYEFVPL